MQADRFFMRYNERDYSKILILILWLIATVININKAFHIDDTFHLEAAQWIENNLFHPFSGKILWNNDPEYIHTFNQPALYFYLLAGIGHFLGYSEISLHLFQSVFTGIAIVYFHKLCSLYYPRQANYLSVLFVFAPGFLLNQNIMVDIPVLSLIILVFYYLLRNSSVSNKSDTALAMALFSVSLLIKYTVISLLPVFIMYWIISKKYKHIPIILLPILALCIWSAFNYWEYGGVHILGRKTNPINYDNIENKFKSYLITFGSMIPFALMYLFSIRNKYRKVLLIVFLLLSVYILIDYIRIYTGQINEKNSDDIIFYFFLFNSILFISTGLIQGYRNITKLKYNQNKYLSSFFILMGLWAGSISLFIIFFSPFMATRHLLLVLVPLLIMNAEILNRISNNIKISFGVITIVLGLGTAISDWNYAEFYRKQPDYIYKAFPENYKIWSLGHWGWKWYSGKTGMHILETSNSRIQKGDILIIPHNYSRQNIPSDIKLSDKYILYKPKTFFQQICVGDFAKMYSSIYPQLPWKLSLHNQEEIHLYWVMDVPD